MMTGPNISPSRFYGKLFDLYSYVVALWSNVLALSRRVFLFVADVAKRNEDTD